MVSVISLAVLIGPQALRNVTNSPRRIRATDLPELGDLHLQAYRDGTSRSKTEKAADRVSAVFDGAYGSPIPQASLMTADVEGRITAAIVTTERLVGNDGSKTAFIAELFTRPDHRRQGLAEELLSHAMQALHDTGYRTLAVTVSSANAAAIALYLSRDFRRLAEPAKD